VPSVWNVSWNGLLADSSAAGAVSAIYRAISTASACAARGHPSCKRQVSGSIPLTGSQLRGGMIASRSWFVESNVEFLFNHDGRIMSRCELWVLLLLIQCA
jgi:hypothetical protein